MPTYPHLFYLFSVRRVKYKIISNQNGDIKMTTFTQQGLDLDALNKRKKKMVEELYEIKVEVLDGGQMPYKAHKSDAGYDLIASEDVTFSQGEVMKHPLNIKMCLPKGTYAHIKGKSGLGSKGLSLLAEIVDENYRGIPHIVATCVVDSPIIIKKGQKIAQLIMHPFSPNYSMVQVDSVDDDTDRGAGGFGSSGE